MDDIILLPRFREQVRGHLVNNYLETGLRPLILGVFGRPGDGKSAQLRSALDLYRVNTLRINASDLESGLAGEPGKLVARTYSIASLEVKKGIPAAIVVDDIDTTMGEWEHNTGTVNHQQVLAELMHIADRRVDPHRGHPCSVPIFVTGNDLLKIYPPLRRHRRMTPFYWRPSHMEIFEVAAQLFRNFVHDSDVRKLVKAYPDETLAFYDTVRQAARESQIGKFLASFDGDMRATLAARMSWASGVVPRQVQFRELADIASAIKESQEEAAQNHVDN